MITARSRAKAAFAAGLLTMFFGALLVFAPGAGASASDIDLYGVDYLGSAYDEDTDTTTFSYQFTGPDGEDISHVVVGAFCITPEGYEDEDFEAHDPSTGKTGYKIGDVATGTILDFTFEGDQDEDPTGATFTLKKQEQKDVITTGPSCTEPPYECPADTVHSGDDGDGVEEEGECNPPYECPAETPVHTDTDGDGFEEAGECSEVEDNEVVRCPAGTTHVDTNGNDLVDDGECETEETPAVTCPEGTTHTDVNGDGVVQSSECAEVKDSTTVKPVVTPTKTVEAPAQPAVLESTTRRALAATGSGSESLTTVGVALMLFGGVLTLGSRRRVRYLR